RNAASCTRLLANSRYSRESLMRAYGLDSHVCYPAVDLDAFTPSGNPRQAFVLGLGHLYAHKGPERAIRALGAIAPEKRPRLLWMGRLVGADCRAEMESLANSLGVDFEARVNVSDEA